MKHSSEKPLAPANYSRCFNNQCPKADNCLHRLAALRDTPEYPSIRIINPLCIPEDSSQCAYFQSTQKIHVAWGISHLLDEVPYKNLQPLKSQLIAHFGRGKYYRFYREESYLSPKTRTISAELSTNTTFRENRLSTLTARNTNGRKVIFSPLFISFYH